MPDAYFRFLAKPLVFVLCLLPVAALWIDAQQTGLGANPVETLTRWSGEWALRFLLLTLTITPLRKLTGWSKLIRLRRMLGLYVFFYASLHFLVLLWFDHAFDFVSIAADILKRPFIAVGFLAWLGLLILALTSNRFSMRKLAGRWQALHRGIYLIALLALLHFFWLVKADVREPTIYLSILLSLFAWRLYGLLRRQTNPDGA